MKKMEEITGMNPRASLENKFRSKLRSIIPSAVRDCYIVPLSYARGIIRLASFSALRF